PPVDLDRFRALEHPASKLNTTIGVVATDAPVTVAQATRLALAGHDGIARAVRPAHSPLDGDTLFAVSTAEAATGVGVDELHGLSAAAAQAVQAAVVDAVTAAVPGHGLAAWGGILAGRR